MKRIKYLKLMPQDFDTLDINGRFNMQYGRPDDCPLARALKRRFKTFCNVDPCGFRVKDKRFGTHNTNYPNVVKLAQRMQKTGKPVILKIQYV